MEEMAELKLNIRGNIYFEQYEMYKEIEGFLHIVWIAGAGRQPGAHLFPAAVPPQNILITMEGYND